MTGIAAVVAFTIALILQLASVSRGVLLTVTTFMLIGLICLSLHLLGVLPLRRGA